MRIATGSRQFGTIDLNTGVFSPINSNIGKQLAGLGELDGTLYGALADPTFLPSESLYKINPGTGHLTPEPRFFPIVAMALALLACMRTRLPSRLHREQ